MLVTMKEILENAKKGKYAVPAPNVDNEHNARAAISAAEEKKSPIILGVPHHANPDIAYFGRILNDLAVRANVPVAIHLDHGRSFEQCVDGIRAQFTSIMVDRSLEPFETNVHDTKEIVKIAHAVNVTVEAELGHVGVGDQYEIDGYSGLTVVDEAVDFVSKTGVDCLAVAIGTAHGVYKGKPEIRFELLKELAKKVPVPLVLHGGSGSGDDNLKKCAQLGICKVNLSNDLKRNAIEELTSQDLSGNAVYGMYGFIGKGFKDKIMHYCDVLESTGKAI